MPVENVDKSIVLDNDQIRYPGHCSICGFYSLIVDKINEYFGSTQPPLSVCHYHSVVSLRVSTTTLSENKLTAYQHSRRADGQEGHNGRSLFSNDTLLMFKILSMFLLQRVLLKLLVAEVIKCRGVKYSKYSEVCTS